MNDYSIKIIYIPSSPTFNSSSTPSTLPKFMTFYFIIKSNYI